MDATNANAGTPRADLVLRGGRVIDPANDVDTIADVAIRNGRVMASGAAADGVPARREIDARGTIVCPGFIDYMQVAAQ
jgi:dihydroorotase